MGTAGESSTTPLLSRAQRRRGITLGLLRALVVAAALLALYFLAPLDRASPAALLRFIVVGLVVLVGVTALQVAAILRAAQPGIRAVEALATSVPLFLLLFSATYFMLSHIEPGSFNAASLTRVDSLYFTVTVFSTVGFGDISPSSQSARMLVTAQMILNLVVLGAGVRLIAGAARRARQVGAQTGGSNSAE